jgi:hypothetical protein
MKILNIECTMSILNSPISIFSFKLQIFPLCSFLQPPVVPPPPFRSTHSVTTHVPSVFYVADNTITLYRASVKYAECVVN